MLDELNDKLNITMNYNSKFDHVPEAEQSNRTIGERIQST